MFGVGLSPIAPGTCGALAALPIAWAIRAGCGRPGLALAAVTVFGVGWWAAGVFAVARGVHDPSEIVIDEVAGQWLALLAAPLDPVAWVLAFALFRVFDIWKPWPVRWIDRRVAGGLGIMLDDLAAAGYALLVFLAVWAIGGAFGVRP